MRLLPALAAAALALSACQSSTTSTSTASAPAAAPAATLTAADTARVPAEQVAACGVNELDMLAVASTLQTHLLLGKGGDKRAYAAALERMETEGGAKDMVWMAEAQSRKNDAAMDAAWKAAAGKPSAAKEALEIKDPVQQADVMLAETDAVVAIAVGCRAAALAGA